MTTHHLLEMMAKRVAGDKERMDRIATTNGELRDENQMLRSRIDTLQVFIEGAKGKYL